ncbi:MAG: bifunctional UDP-3-O-[3-hydroxymyristoyl] N-acetylglucosamine deacetylase/3-hydroxyacyl-ACP dehydratase [bacterium]|nr:bifunctional UDP-3-O-[3-hydroxymyristoyl] N-acetylglucosamine deacetylase/3-hydroxyacyl-ACP dehydratase [bacterium]
MKQRTIKKEISIEGIGLQTGEMVRMVLKPASIDYGIQFVRGSTKIPAKLEYVVSADREIILEKGRVRVRTIEHLLAALACFSISNLIIELDGEEPPILDGSALGFVELIRSIGIEEQEEWQKVLTIEDTIRIEEKKRSLVLLPSEKFKITYTISFDHPMIGTESTSFEMNEKRFIEEIAPARTFGFLDEVEELRKRGLAKGGSLENAIVIDTNGIINKEALRFPDELARHKILDLLGDLSLLGYPLKGEIAAYCSGHSMNIRLANMLAERIKNKDRRIKIEGGEKMIDAKNILGILPHRYPFLLVDRILEMEKGKKAIGLKNVSINEEFFCGHFPGHPVMPGVLIIEAMAQVAGVLVLSEPENRGKLVYFAGLDKVRFRKPVTPGDQLKLEIIPVKIKKKVGVCEGKAYVGEDLVAEATLLFSVAER